MSLLEKLYNLLPEANECSHDEIVSTLEIFNDTFTKRIETMADSPDLSNLEKGKEELERALNKAREREISDDKLAIKEIISTIDAATSIGIAYGEAGYLAPTEPNNVPCGDLGQSRHY